MIDFDAIRRDYSLPEVARQSGVELKANGREFIAHCCFHNDSNPSMSIYPAKDKVWMFHCFSCGASGNVIDFVKERYGLSAVDAAKFLTGDEARAVQYKCNEVIKHDPYDGLTVVKPPANAPVLTAGQRTVNIWNPKRDKFVNYTPSMAHPYKNKRGELLGYVIRQDIGDRKITPQIVWVTGKYTGWCHGSFNDPRPLYNLPDLYDRQSAQVLIVEGEKCADAARAALPNVVAMTWAGGAKSFHKTHWKSLEGRKVIIWPDAGVKGTAIVPPVVDLLKACGVTEIKIVDAPDKPCEWDIADLIEEGGNVTGYIRDNIRTVWPDTPPAPRAEPEPELTPLPSIPAPSDNPLDITPENYKSMYLCNSKGVMNASAVYNWCIMLQYEHPFRDMFAWNSFANEIYLMKKPTWDRTSDKFKPRPISDTDITAIYTILETMHVTPKENMLGKAIVRVSDYNRYNPVVDALEKLKWDGVKRLFGDEKTPCWASYYLGAENSDINKVFGARWFISACARAYEPGCKVDTMIILEGDQGLKKSSVIQAISDSLMPDVFTEIKLDPSNKDSALKLQGMLVVEIAELSGMSKAEVEDVKSWLVTKKDRFRRPYGKITENFPRSSIFAGTHNPTEGMGYLKDQTGGRRFWPIACEGIDLEGVKADGAQLWAEAVHYYKQGEQWWLTADEETLAKEAQKERLEFDPWGDIIDQFIAGHEKVTLSGILNCLEIPKERRTIYHAKRVSAHMQNIGWTSEKHRASITYYKPELAN